MRKYIYVSVLFAAFILFGLWYDRSFDKINNYELSTKNENYTYSKTTENNVENNIENTTDIQKTENNVEKIEKNTSEGVDKNQNSEQNNKYKININTADVTELSALPGIGNKKAADIVSYREENNGFDTVDDIKNVNGIGDKIFDSVKDLITVGQ